MAMKKFYKSSPLVTRAPLVTEIDTETHYDLLQKSLSNRATIMLIHLVNSEDPLKVLILLKTIEWLQKLENLKILINFNSIAVTKRGTDKIAVDLIK